MTSTKHLTIEEKLALQEAQGVPFRHMAFICPSCNTVQSLADFMKHLQDADLDLAKGCIGYYCIGHLIRNVGCTLSHRSMAEKYTTEVSGPCWKYPCLEIATPEVAQEHARYNGWRGEDHMKAIVDRHIRSIS